MNIASKSVVCFFVVFPTFCWSDVLVEPSVWMGKYEYVEPSMRLAGVMSGVGVDVLSKYGADFLAAGFEIGQGSVDYESNGYGWSSGLPAKSYLLKFSGGRSWEYGGMDVRLRGGFDFRMNFQSGSGLLTSDGFELYGRERRQVIFPLGIDLSFNKFNFINRVSFSFSPIVMGVNISHLMSGEVRNRQDDGRYFDVRFGIDYKSLSFDLYFKRVVVEKSKPATCGGGYYICIEPRNIESGFGLQAGYRF